MIFSIDSTESDHINFEFEDEIDNPESEISITPAPSHPSEPSVRRPRRFKEVVCRLWLTNSCPHDDDACNFLHRFDESKMPICNAYAKYGQCLKPNCIYKHSELPEKECISYNSGFCPKGESCRYKHNKLPGPPPPVEEIFQKLKQSDQYKNRSINISLDEEKEKSLPKSKFSARRHLRENSRYFIIKSDNIENLQLSIDRGMWATTQKNEDILNDAFGSCDNLVLVFSVNETGHFQGFALMKSFVGVVPGRMDFEWNGRGGQPKVLGKNFMVKWIKTCGMPFQKTRYLKNAYNENKPVQIGRDCQEVEPRVGQQLISLILNEDDHPTLVLAENDDVDYDVERYEYFKYGL